MGNNLIPLFWIIILSDNKEKHLSALDHLLLINNSCRWLSESKMIQHPVHFYGHTHVLSLFLLCVEAGGKKLRSTIQRSTETGLAVEMRSRMTRQASRESTDGSMNSYSSEGK